MPFRQNWQSRPRSNGAPIRRRSFSRRFAQTGDIEVDEQDDAAVKRVITSVTEILPTPDVEEMAEVELPDLLSNSGRSPSISRRSSSLEKDITDEKAPVVKIPGVGLGVMVTVTHARSVSQSTTGSTDVESTDVDSVPAPSDSETDVDTSFASLIVHDISVAAVEPTPLATEAMPNTTDDEDSVPAAPVSADLDTSEKVVDTPRPPAQLPATTSKPVDAAVTDTASASGLPQPQFAAPPFYYPYAIPTMPYFPSTPQRPSAASSDKSINTPGPTHAQPLGTQADQQQHWPQHMPMHHAPYGMPSIMYDQNGLAVPVPWVHPTQAAMYYPHSRPDMQQHPAQGTENTQLPQAQQHNQFWTPAFYSYPPQMWFGGAAGQNNGGDGTFPSSSHQHQHHQHEGAGVSSYAVPFKVLRNPMGGPMNAPGPIGTGRNDKNASLNFSINSHAPMFRASGPGTPVSPTHPHMHTYPSLNAGDAAWTAPYMHDQTPNPHAFAPYHAVMMHHPTAAAAAAQMQHVPGGRYGGNAGPPLQQW